VLKILIFNIEVLSADSIARIKQLTNRKQQENVSHYLKVRLEDFALMVIKLLYQ
jgi:hypothetical protein